MGIRNSFGMDFDPLTGNLWDTENGPAAGDEINMVNPGFNNGWSLIQKILHGLKCLQETKTVMVTEITLTLFPFLVI
jgi:glucose/arabinose dehydrogenase